MPRWEPNTKERIAYIALSLFFEKGYNNTTITEIAAKANINKSTYFRYFSNKQDVIAVNQENICHAIEEGIGLAPVELPVLDVVKTGLMFAIKTFPPQSKEIGLKLKQLYSDNPELQQRYQIRTRTISTTIVESLQKRLVSILKAEVAADIGLFAFNLAYENWIEPYNNNSLEDLLALKLEAVKITLKDL